ncbi:MAG: hypothetical protein O3A00_22400 [Planctomycetota bacterium]|nr:hypothetical protein [Planctomycetota bacterium]
MRPIFGVLFAITVLFVGESRSQSAEPAFGKQPNIILIMTDDMNYGCCCGEEIARENHCFSPSSEMN